LLIQVLTSGNSVRVFFAIWPEGAIRNQLYSLSERLEAACSGRKMRTENIHLTLVFLGEIRASQLDMLRSAANTVREQSFDFIVDRAGYWKHSRLVYATAGEVPQRLIRLVDLLKAHMSANGHSFENRTFKPHITLVRKVRLNFLPNSLLYLDKPIIWPVNDWVLVKSEQASDRTVYTPIGRWALISLKDKYSFPSVL